MSSTGWWWGQAASNTVSVIFLGYNQFIQFSLSREPHVASSTPEQPSTLVPLIPRRVPLRHPSSYASCFVARHLTLSLCPQLHRHLLRSHPCLSCHTGQFLPQTVAPYSFPVFPAAFQQGLPLQLTGRDIVGGQRGCGVSPGLGHLQAENRGLATRNPGRCRAAPCCPVWQLSWRTWRHTAGTEHRTGSHTHQAPQSICNHAMLNNYLTACDTTTVSLQFPCQKFIPQCVPFYANPNTLADWYWWN